MGFSGGGSNVLLPHTHDGTVTQDGGPLDFNNITQSQSAAGEVFFSDGAHLQQLAYPGVPAGETLTAVAASAAPSWVASPAASAVYELVDTETLAADAGDITLSMAAVSGSTVSQFIMTFNGAVTTLGEELRLRINGDSTSDYVTERLNVIGGVSSANTHTDTYFHLCPANASLRYFGNVNIQVGHFGTGPVGGSGVYMSSDFVTSGAHFMYSGYISGNLDTTLSEVKIESFGAGGNIKDESCASLFKVNI